MKRAAGGGVGDNERVGVGGGVLRWSQALQGCARRVPLNNVLVLIPVKYKFTNAYWVMHCANREIQHAD